MSELEKLYEVPSGSTASGICRGCNSRQVSMVNGLCGDCTNLQIPKLVTGHAQGVQLARTSSDHAEFTGSMEAGHVFLNGVVYDLVARDEVCSHEDTKVYDALTKNKSNFCMQCGQRMRGRDVKTGARNKTVQGTSSSSSTKPRKTRGRVGSGGDGDGVDGRDED